MAQFSIKRYLPRGLYGRAALILLVPIITLQVVVSLAFIQRLYEGVTEQMTQNITVGLEILVQVVEDAPSLEVAQSDLAVMARALNIEAEIPGAAVTEGRAFFDLSGRVVGQVLRARFETISGIDLLSNDKLVHLSLTTSKGPMQVEFSRRRVSAANPHQLLVWMVATGFLMTLIAYLFLRNQLRPIRRLSRAAEAFGKGEVVKYHPSGAVEVRAAGNAFLNMRARIERQIEQRTLMLSGVSHDLRTPLTRLKLGLSMQEETAATNALQDDASEMERLIDTFLDFARLDAVEDRETTELRGFIEMAVKNIRGIGREVALTLPEGDLPELKLRPIAMARAVENLISNAVRYGTHVSVTVDVLDSAVRIRVEDDGPGIPPEAREEALKPFARLDAARNQNKGSGVGLGLAIAADVVRSHGGTLRLGDSENLGGLCADIVLPR